MFGGVRVANMKHYLRGLETQVMMVGLDESGGLGGSLGTK